MMTPITLIVNERSYGEKAAEYYPLGVAYVKAQILIINQCISRINHTNPPLSKSAKISELKKIIQLINQMEMEIWAEFFNENYTNYKQLIRYQLFNEAKNELTQLGQVQKLL